MEKKSPSFYDLLKAIQEECIAQEHIYRLADKDCPSMSTREKDRIIRNKKLADLCINVSDRKIGVPAFLSAVAQVRTSANEGMEYNEEFE